MGTDGATSAETQAANGKKYKTKTINFRSHEKTTLLQNDNDRCALIAICNALLLQGKIDIIPDVTKEISEQVLISNLDSMLRKLRILEKAELIESLPKLSKDFHIEPKFNGINEFSASTEIDIFKMLGVPLCHGWVVDPSYDASVANIISSSSYDKLKCVADKLEVIFVDSEQISDDQVGLILKFLEETSSHLTKHGLSRLKDELEEHVPCILFWNDQLSTMTKFKS